MRVPIELRQLPPLALSLPMVLLRYRVSTALPREGNAWLTRTGVSHLDSSGSCSTGARNCLPFGCRLIDRSDSIGCKNRQKGQFWRRSKASLHGRGINPESKMPVRTSGRHWLRSHARARAPTREGWHYAGSTEERFTERSHC